MSKRWQYLTVEVKPKTWRGFDPNAVQEQLNRQGSLGWELVQATTTSYYFPMLLLFKKEA